MCKIMATVYCFWFSCLPPIPQAPWRRRKNLLLLLLFSHCHVRLFATPWTAVSQTPLSFTIFWSLLRLMSIVVVMLSHPLPPFFFFFFLSAFSLFQHQSLSQWVGSMHEVAKVFGLQLQHQSFQWIIVQSLPLHCSMPGSSVLYYLLKYMSIELVMLYSHFILCYSLILSPSIFPSTGVISDESALCIRWPKYWSFSFKISSSNEYSGLISFRIDWLVLLAVQGTLKSLLQHHSSKASILWW